MDQEYKDLVQQIIVRAGKDYVLALTKLNKNPLDKRQLKQKKELEEFFYSDYFYELTDLNASYLIKLIKKKCNYI